MGRRTNPIGIRVGSMLSWPATTHHPMLERYVSHIFQHLLVSKPCIRASTTEIWINVTLLDTQLEAAKHPRVIKPILDLRGVDLGVALGKLEQRTLTMVFMF